MKAKYVIYDDGNNYISIIFPSHVDHFLMVPKNCEIHSAGFVQLYVDENKNVNIDAYGKSVSLKIGTNNESTRLLQQMLRIGEYY